VQTRALIPEPAVNAPPRVRVRKPVIAGAAVVLSVLFVVGLWLYLINGGAQAPNGRDYTLGILIASGAFGIPGAVLAGGSRVPGLGWVSLGAGLSLGLSAAMTGWALRSLHTAGGLPGGPLALWISVWCWIPGYGLVATLLLLLVPRGRLTRGRDRAIACVSLLAIAATTAGTALGPYTYSDLPRAYAGHGNPVLHRGIAHALGFGAVWLLPCVAASLGTLIARFRSSPADEREQLKWVAVGAALTIVLFAGAFAVGPHGDALFAAAMLPLPVGVTVAALRHGLWDVDLVINRSLVYLTLSAAAIIFYAGAVAVVRGTVGGLLAVVVIVVGLHPVHRRVQGAVNRLLYGERDDPGVMLRLLGDRLVAVAGVEDVLPAAAETVARALQVPYAAVELTEGAGGSYGVPVAEPTRLPLLYQGTVVGQLVVSPRDPGARLSAADLRALEAISRQLGPAAHAVQLSHELQRSRERIVVAREEERRRLRRELHDSLGPTLAALALEFEAARDVVVTDPRRVDATLERASSRATEMVSDVRRMVYDLRPPTLDDLGLLGAVREQADRLSVGRLSLQIDAPDQLPPLPAAVEAAAYRIVSEALANAVRHSGARRCSVTLDLEADWLTVRVRDDGQGIGPATRQGVGLLSMRERAEELGGAFEIGSLPEGGAQVTATLPVSGHE
jgi:signal transduction histidine kinase